MIKIRAKIKSHTFKLEIFSPIVLLLLFFTGLYFYGYAEEDFVYEAKGKRDPFIPLVTAEGRLLKLDRDETKSDAALEGIIYDKNGKSFAIINGSIVAKGDVIGDYQVANIEEEKVILLKDGQVIEVELKKEGE